MWVKTKTQRGQVLWIRVWVDGVMLTMSATRKAERVVTYDASCNQNYKHDLRYAYIWQMRLISCFEKSDIAVEIIEVPKKPFHTSHPMNMPTTSLLNIYEWQ